MGKLCELLPFGNIAYRLNILSALAAVMAAVLLYRLLFLVLKDCFTASAGALVFALAPVFWVNAVTAEVYTSQTALVAGMLLCFVTGIRTRSNHYFYAAFFIAGAGTAVHVSTILYLVPAAVPMIWKHLKSQSKIFRYVLFYLGGTSIYLYLPIRAFMNPVINWGNPHNLSLLVNHLLAKQYSQIMSAGVLFNVPVMLERLKFLVTFLAQQYPNIILVYSVMGFVIILKRRKRVWLFLVLLALCDIFYCTTINFEGLKDHQAGFILCAACAVCAGIGLRAVIGVFQPFLRGSSLFLTIVVIAACLPFLTLLKPYVSCDKHDHYSAYKWGHSMRAVLPPGSVAFFKQSDSISIAWYLSMTEHHRDDAVCISRNQIASHNYVFNTLNHYPQSENSDRLVMLMEDLYRQSTLLYDSVLLTRLRSIPGNYFWELGGETPGYYSFLMPAGLLFQVAPYPGTHFSSISSTLAWLKEDLTWKYDWKAVINIKTSLYNRALYYYHTGNHDMASTWNNYALGLFPRDSRLENNLAVAYASLGEYEIALNLCKGVINRDPSYPLSYKNAGIISEMMGDTQSARMYYRKALILDPDDREIRDTLEKLDQELFFPISSGGE